MLYWPGMSPAMRYLSTLPKPASCSRVHCKNFQVSCYVCLPTGSPAMHTVLPERKRLTCSQSKFLPASPDSLYRQATPGPWNVNSLFLQHIYCQYCQRNRFNCLRKAGQCCLSVPGCLFRVEFGYKNLFYFYRLYFDTKSTSTKSNMICES